jgi:hypothetical protein
MLWMKRRDTLVAWYRINCRLYQALITTRADENLHQPELVAVQGPVSPRSSSAMSPHLA